MLPRLAGWAQIASACAALWVVPSAAALQDRQRSTAAGPDTAVLTPLLTLPERASPPPRALATPPQDDQSAQGHVSRLLDGVAWNWERTFIAAAAMIGAVLLSLPLAYIYLRTKPEHEFDSSVLFSIVFLAATIAGILIVVQGSIARALSLAGVVSAVRFRSSLKDSNDAVYILGAIAVGLAAGSNELDVGVAISVLLPLTLVLLWKVRLDVVKRAILPKDHESRHGHHHHDPDLTEPSVERSTSPAANGNGEGAAPASMSELRPKALARLAYIVLETEHAERTRLLVETFLERETKSWRLDGASGNGGGHRDRYKGASGLATLMYLVRFRKGSHPEAIVERLKAVGRSSHFSVRLETGDEVGERFA
jgi:hypothetical protein